MVLQKIAFILIATFFFDQATYSNGDLGDHQDLHLKFNPDMTRKDLLNYCYSFSTFCRIKIIDRKTSLYNVPKNSEDKVRVFQWNILAQALGENLDKFVCPPDAMQWICRRCEILEEILTFESDVVCLQEVDHFDFFSRALATQSYSGEFLPKVPSLCVEFDKNNGPDGCVIFYNTNKYKLLAKHEMAYSAVGSKQVALLVVLENKISKKKLCVVTTHLKSRKGMKEAILRNLQGKELLKFVSQRAVNCPTIITGDFNAEPTEPVYSTMTVDSIFKSAYNRRNKEPEFTSWKFRQDEGEVKEILDYIFYTPKYLTVSSIVDMPREGAIGKGRIPSLIYPSDHFSLITDFCFNETQCSCL